MPAKKKTKTEETKQVAHLRLVKPAIEIKLMEPNSLPVFHSELMTFSTGEGDKKVEHGYASVAINGSAVYISTNLQHPDKPDRTAMYVMPLASFLLDVFNTLHDNEAEA